MMVQTSVVIK